MTVRDHEPPGPRPPRLHPVRDPDDDGTGGGGGQEPHDHAAEQAALGAMLLTTTAVNEVNATTRPAHHHTPAHELIHHAINQVHATGARADAVTVADQLARNGTLTRAGGAPYLHTLISTVPTTANAPHYAAIVTEHHHRRALIAAARRIQQLGASAETLHQATTEAAQELDKARPAADPATLTTWAAVDLEPYLHGEQAPTTTPTLLPRTDGPCLLYPGAVHSVSGEPESGKSWLALYAARHELDQAHTVVYIDFEDRAARVVARLLDLGAHPAQIAAHLRYIRPTTAATVTDLTGLLEQATDATLAVIDGITEAMTTHGLSLIDNTDVARWLALLPRPLADQGAAVLQIDHVVKNAETRGRYAIGGQHKLAALDGAAYQMTVTEPFGRGKRGTARVVVDKDREGHVRAAALGHTIGTFTLDSRDTATHTADQLRATLDPPTVDLGPDGQFRPTVLMEKVSRYLEVNPGAAKAAIEDTVTGKREHVRTAIRTLINEGYVRAEQGQRGSLHHHIDRPFRKDDE